MTAPLERLLGLARWERAGMRLGLDRIEALLTALGRPEAGLRIVHIGGTNGKGSVAALTPPSFRPRDSGRVSTLPRTCSA